MAAASLLSPLFQQHLGVLADGRENELQLVHGKKNAVGCEV